jgi:hypothetical protein
LLDPPRGVGAQFATLRRVKTFDGLHQADISFRNQVEQRETKVRVVVRDLDDQAQVRTNHERARFAVALLDLRGELDLLIGRQERDLPDLAEINLYSSVAIFGSHKTSHVKGDKGAGAMLQLLRIRSGRRLHAQQDSKVFN